ncbi:uroporphyrinogen-III synthase [Thermomonas sp. HDW16]|uniref:uroporphyrinogen-III synthase n=1 Tax=Thermomonas sp. HDW16 TaxID=2714945 RepID=UPI00140A12C4|nr:uroporphyrinogen-III synthase [Thermomonas sp. HDW16]QIL19568.1 uroporphyrinogen-III synthase [Thermomonas sp. HDW16]
MPRVADQALPLQHWCVLSLRPRGQHAALRVAARRYGAHTLALSPFAIDALDDAPTRAALKQALRADVVLYTSPNAVATAALVQSLQARRGQRVLAVGSGTQRALRRHGVVAQAPLRMDSEGLLAMPALADVTEQRIGLVTGAGGRNLLAPTLRRRGAEVLRADVYARVALSPTPQALEKLRIALADPEHVLLPLSSSEALRQLLAELPASLRKPFSRIAIAAASARLADTAREAGFRRIAVATDARPASLLHAAIDAFV